MFWWRVQDWHDWFSGKTGECAVCIMNGRGRMHCGKIWVHYVASKCAENYELEVLSGRNVFLCSIRKVYTRSVIQEEILKCDHSRESKSGGSTFEYGDGILWCDQSNDGYPAILSRENVCYAVQVGSDFWAQEQNPKVLPNSTFLSYC